jgi:hypothetical protein
VTLRCSAATDGAVAGYWIANARPPFAVHAVTLAGAAFDGVAALRPAPASHCGVDQTWTWNGFQFELMSSSGSGLCRGAEWNLPTVVTQGNPAK